MNEIKSLTSLRGIFAMWVLAYHLIKLAPFPLPDLAGLLAKGYLGVDFFFLLSGFILASVYAGRFVGDIRLDQSLAFLISRFGRLFPLHLVIISACVFSAWFFDRAYSPIQVVQESLLIQRWPFVHALFHGINGPSWSISTEWLANILFPVFVALMIAGSRLVAGATGAVSVLVIVLLSWRHDWSLDRSTVDNSGPLLRCFAEFALGMLIYRCRQIGLSTDLAAFAWIAALVTAICLHLPDPVVVLVMMPVILAAAANRQRAQRVLTVGWLHQSGELSYSIYLVHLPIITALNWGIARLYISGSTAAVIYVIAAICLTFGVSIFTFRWVEGPARDYSKHLARQIIASSARRQKLLHES
jgi:peptidoglycan/LPS O-acetylase OafA/YrhL